jgi:predicted HicB family RNase H-like nuclease
MVLQAKTGRRDSDAKDRVLAEISAEPTKRLNVEIPASLHRRIKMASAAGDTTITEMVVDALERYLNAIE